MKQLLLFITCLGLSISALAQRKYELGVVFKAGNFSFGDHTLENSLSYYDYISKNTFTHPGMSVVVGGYQAFRLGKHFSLTAELLYRYSNYSMLVKYKQQSLGTSSPFNYEQDENKLWSESNIALPVRIHYTFRKNGRTSLSFGGGISRIIALERKEVQSPINLTGLDKNIFLTNRYVEDKWRNFDNILSVTTGVSQRITDNTRVGLEFTFERNRRLSPNFAYGYAYDCFCEYERVKINTPKLQNIAVSLYHNLLR